MGHYPWNVINGTEIHCILEEGRALIWEHYMGRESIGQAIDRGVGTEWTFEDAARWSMRRVYPEHALIYDNDVRDLAMALYKHAVEVCTAVHKALTRFASNDPEQLVNDARVKLDGWLSVLDKQPQKSLL